MGAIYAELRVGGHVFPVLKCTYGVHQATDRRGRVIEKVRFEGAKLLLDVPRTDFLGVWAADPHKRLPADVIFRDAAGGAAVETLSFQGAYCVHHREVFTAGDAHGGSYVLFLDLSDPDGFTMHAGGPAADFVVPAAREHGVPPVAVEFERERKEITSAEAGGALVALGVAAGPIAPGLAAMLGTTLLIEDLGAFAERVTADLQLIYATSTGKNLLDSLHASGKCVDIVYSMGGNEVGKYEDPAARYSKEGGTPGAGTSCRVGYNPTLESIGPEPWATRPPAIALAHELVHAEQAAYGRMAKGRAGNGLVTPPPGASKAEQADIRELEAVGVPPHDQYLVNENKIRSEWQPPQPKREYY